MNFSYAAVKQLEGKYLARNRVIDEAYESMQFLYILVAACLLLNYPRETRLDYIKCFYSAVSTFKISLPTPIMSSVRTPTRQFSSYILIRHGNSLDSINATSSAIMKYAPQRARIGINAGRIRTLGSPIRGSEAFYTGCILFYKHSQTTVKSCSQGGVRGGAVTLFYPMQHLGVESLLVLKNNHGTDANRVRHMDYGVQTSKPIYTRLLKGGNITLFSPSNIPGPYDAFFTDQDEFERLYTQYERDNNIRRQRVKAVKLSSLMVQEHVSTSRTCVRNVNHCDTRSSSGPVVAPVHQSNLCLEITLPAKPLEDVNDENGGIALCTLSAFNLDAIDSLDELEELVVLAARALDALLGYQDYPILAAKRGTMGRRMLGIGVANFAYHLTEHGKRYSDGSANNLTHKTFETTQYYLLKASNGLAIEQGACPWLNETTYTQGILPIDTCKKDLDGIVSKSLYFDWGALCESIKTHSLRNLTFSVLIPSETSSQIFSATNGTKPPRDHINTKASKDGTLRQVVPDYENPQNVYKLLWGVSDNDGYLQLVGIMQESIDQSTSANTNCDPTRLPSGGVPMQQLLKDLLNAYKFDVKMLYYHSTRDGTEDTQDGLAPFIQDDGCESGTCKI